MQIFWWPNTFIAAISNLTLGKSSPSCFLSMILMATLSPVTKCVAALTLAKPPVPTKEKKNRQITYVHISKSSLKLGPFEFLEASVRTIVPH